MTSWAPDIGRRRGPLYRALADALADDVAAGRLRPGTRLPTHRELADRLGVTIGTVTRGYAEAARRGLLAGEVGRGTFVRGGVGVEPVAAFGVPAGGDLIDLSLNHPPPLAEAVVARTLASLARRGDLARLLDYAPAEGALAHREAGARWVAEAGIRVPAEQVLVAGGSQHALTAVFATVAGPGDLVLTEALTFAGVKALAALLRLRLQGLPMDEQGLLPDAFEAACRGGGVKALYCIPTIQNPTGAVLPEARRREVARIARAHGVLVVEDDVHGLLAPDAPPPIATLAPESVCYLLGTAKTLAPGLRTGFLVAPSALVPRLAAAVRATTWMAAPLMAEVVSRWIADGTARDILKQRRDEARARQRLAAARLKAERFQAHPSAHHLWLSLPEPWRSETFAEEVRRRGVAVAPAQAFIVGRSAAPHAVRVCLGAQPDRSRLERGLGVVADVLRTPAASAVMVV
jgi:DNA-binding transcriptional MocR family regulator